MTTITTRAGKGSPLTNAELDANFTNLNTYKVEQDASGNVTVGGVLSVLGMASAASLWATSAFSGTFTDGIVLDYTTGTGRISVGSGDGLSIYNGGVGGTALLNLDQYGNLGLGVALSGWNSAYRAFQFQGGSVASVGTGEADYLHNSYINSGGNYAYVNTAAAARYTQAGGVHYWFNAPSGTAGSAISFTQAMTLNASGQLLNGLTSIPTGFTSSYGNYWAKQTASNLYGFVATSASSDAVTYVGHNGTVGAIGVSYGSTAGFTPLAFYTSDSEKMRLTSAGYLGIGTSSPSYPLDVLPPAGSAVVARFTGNRSAASYNAQIHFASAFYGGGDLWAIGNSVATDDATRNFDIYDLVAGANRLRLDSSGNLGLGVTPSGWNTSFRALQVGSRASLYQDGSASTVVGNNIYNDTGGTNRYLASATASLAIQTGGQHIWLTAPSGTAGSAISFTQAMTLFPSGGLSLGNTTDLGAKTINVGITASTTNTLVGAINFQGYTSTYGAGIASYIPSGAPGIDWQDLRFYISQGPAAINGERMRLDTSGNLGLGVTPSAWVSGIKAFQFNTTGALWANSSTMFLTNNTYTDGTDKYLTTAAATRYYQAAGAHIWNTAPSGTAGNAISFTQAMTLDCGTSVDRTNFIVGATSTGDSSAGRGVVHVNGSSSAILSLNVGNVRKGYFYTQGTDIITSAEGGSFSIQTTTAQPLVLSTNSSERGRFDTAGNFLVGTTTSPSGSSGAVVASVYKNNLAQSITVAALNTSYNMTQLGNAFNGIIVVRDNTTGGSAVYLQDPNTGFVLIASNLQGGIVFSITTGPATSYYAQLKQTAGPTGHNFTFIGFGI